MGLWNTLKAPVLDRIIRNKAQLHKINLDKYTVRIARTTEEYEDAFKLLHVAYVFQGIESVRNTDLRITPQHVLPEATVFVCYEGEQPVGTMTVTLDSPAGLPLDHDYPKRVKSLRNSGKRLVEFGSLAVVKRCWATGVTALLNIAAAYWSINMLQATHCIIGIHPRGAPLYRAIYTFAPLGPACYHAELEAPVLGMIMSFERVVQHLRKKFKKPLGEGIAFVDYMTVAPPACIRIPLDVPEHELIRWKLPRSVFKEIFIHKSDRLAKLDPVTLKYLQRYRTEATLETSALIPDRQLVTQNEYFSLA